MKSILFFLFLMSASSFADGRRPRYKVTIDPMQAEQILSNLAGRQPLEEKTWLDLVGEKKSESYEIKKGDNLWYLSRKMFGDAFLWRKLWEVNSNLSNPHELNVGDTIFYYNPNRGLASTNEIRIPLQKLLPPKAGQAVDIQNDAVLNLTVKNRFRPMVFVLTPQDEVYGEVTGSYSYGAGLNYADKVYVTDDLGKLKPGERYGIVRFERVLRDSTDKEQPVIGTVVRLVGHIEIDEIGELLVRGQLRDIYAMVKRGDKLIREQSPTAWDIFIDPPENLQARVVMGEDSEAKLFVQGSLILLNKGESDGMKQGYVFRVWQDRDGFTDRQIDVEPVTKGEVRVVHVSPLSSVGMVTKSAEPIEIGDFLVPRQTFSNPPAMKERAKVVVEIQ